ncbi:MAG: polysaccharide pyruvyl transferase family protein [Deltaproteobacteria bacterium]
MRVLVAGWFSFEQMGATAGDLMARDVACEWIRRSGLEYDVAHAPPFRGGVDWKSVEPQTYSHVIFVCGPFGNGPPVTEFLERFVGKKLIGLDLSMLQDLHEWNPFDLLLERDSSVRCRPDLAFLCCQPPAPVVGVVLIHPQPEYGARDVHARANAAIERLIAGREMAPVRIDTRLDVNGTGLRTAAEIESLIARMDVVLTTRLHGTVLALKNGVPAVAIDPVAGGAKIRRQAETIGWPTVLDGETVTEEELSRAFDFCLTQHARDMAKQCAVRANQLLVSVSTEFASFLIHDPG